MRSSKCLAATGVLGILISVVACGGTTEDFALGDEVTSVTAQAETAPVNPLARVRLGFYGGAAMMTLPKWKLGGRSASPGVDALEESVSPFMAPGVATKLHLTKNGTARDYFAFFDGGKWTIDSNGSGYLEPEDQRFEYGAPGDVPVTGSWSASGLGVYRNGTWILDTNGNGVLDDADAVRFFGAAGDTPVVGDWNGDGKSKIGFFRQGKWWLDLNGSGGWDAGDAVRTFGAATDFPFVWPAADGKHDRIGVFDGYVHWTFDSNGDGSLDSSDISGDYVGVPKAGTYAYGVPMVGDWKNDVVSFLKPNGHGSSTDPTRTLAAPLSVTLRTSAADPSSTETLTYETEYVATATLDSIRWVETPLTPISFGAGGQSAVVGFPGGARFTVVGPDRLTVGDSGAKPLFNSARADAYFKTWYTAPTDGTLLRWADLAKAQADILTRSGNAYLMAKDYRQVGTFNRDQLTVLASSVKLWLDAAKTPIERLKWQAVYDSLIASRDGQPLPVSPKQFQQYLDELVNNAKADMLMQVERAQAILDMFTKTQTALTNATESLSADIAANLATSRAKLDAKAAQARPALQRAIDSAPKA